MLPTSGVSRTLRSSVLTVTLLAGLTTLTACGGSDSDGSAGSTSSPSTTSAADVADDATTEAPVDAGNPTFVDSTDNPAATLAMGEDAFTPDEVTIKVGDVVEFTSGDGSVHSLVAGTLAGVTVANGLSEWYRFDKPGTYTMTDEINEDTATITVD